jgi:GNAT superfamily N-acetyltransferase
VRRGARARRAARRGVRGPGAGARRRQRGRRSRGGRGLTPGELLIRPAVVADAAEVARVQIAGWRAGYAGLVDEEILADLDESERARRWASTLDDTDALIAQDHDGVAGFVAMAVPARELDEPGVGEITALYVDPPRWRGGVGRALIDAAGAELRDEGCDAVVLWTFEASEPSRAFYAALGFEPDGARSTHQRARIDEIRLRARLD